MRGYEKMFSISIISSIGVIRNIAAINPSSVTLGEVSYEHIRRQLFEQSARREREEQLIQSEKEIFGLVRDLQKEVEYCSFASWTLLCLIFSSEFFFCFVSIQDLNTKENSLLRV